MYKKRNDLREKDETGVPFMNKIKFPFKFSVDQILPHKILHVDEILHMDETPLEMTR